MPPTDPSPFEAIERAALLQQTGERAAKSLAAARTRLILGPDATSAFFATLALRLSLAADDACETMSTDGVSLRYSPAFVTGLSPDELLGVLAHEVLHNALAHPFRRGDRDSSRWNVACDLAANPLLLAAMGDVEPQDSGLASGIVNTAFMMGGALGLAVLAAIATSRTDNLVSSGENATEALLSGYHYAFVTGAIFAIIAAISAPTSLAVEFARANHQTLIGFLRGETMNVYVGTVNRES